MVNLLNALFWTLDPLFKNWKQLRRVPSLCSHQIPTLSFPFFIFPLPAVFNKSKSLLTVRSLVQSEFWMVSLTIAEIKLSLLSFIGGHLNLESQIPVCTNFLFIRRNWKYILDFLTTFKDFREFSIWNCCLHTKSSSPTTSVSYLSAISSSSSLKFIYHSCQSDILTWKYDRVTLQLEILSVHSLGISSLSDMFLQIFSNRMWLAFSSSDD